MVEPAPAPAKKYRLRPRLRLCNTGVHSRHFLQREKTMNQRLFHYFFPPSIYDFLRRRGVGRVGPSWRAASYWTRPTPSGLCPRYAECAAPRLRWDKYLGNFPCWAVFAKIIAWVLWRNFKNHFVSHTFQTFWLHFVGAHAPALKKGTGRYLCKNRFRKRSAAWRFKKWFYHLPNLLNSTLILFCLLFNWTLLLLVITAYK